MTDLPGEWLDPAGGPDARDAWDDELFGYQFEEDFDDPHPEDQEREAERPDPDAPAAPGDTGPATLGDPSG